MASKNLGLSQEELARMNDSKVQNVIETVSALCKSRQSFEALMRNLPEKIGNRLLVSKGKEGRVIEAPENKTLKQYAEDNYIQTKRFGVGWMTAFNSVRELYQMNSLRSLKTLLESCTWQDGDIVTREVIEEMLCLKELERAVYFFHDDTNKWVDECSLFYLNALDAIEGEDGEGKMKTCLAELKEAEQGVSDAKAALDELVAEKGRLLGEKAKNASQLEAMHAMSRSKEEGIKVLEKNLATTNANLKDAQVRLERYTFQMYGSQTYMWKNDVALAEADRERFVRDKAELEEALQEARDGNVPETEHQIHELEGIATKLQENYETLASTSVSKPGKILEQHGVLKEKEKYLGEIKDKVKRILGSKGAINAEHLFSIQDVVLNHAKCSDAVAVRHTTSNVGWKPHMVHAIQAVKAVAAAKTPEMILFKLGRLWHFLVHTEPKFLYFMKSCHMITDLESSGYGTVPITLPSECFNLAPDPFIGAPALPATVTNSGPSGHSALETQPTATQEPSTAMTKSAVAMRNVLAICDNPWDEPELPEADE